MARIRIGIIGANPDRGWAFSAHIPGLMSAQGLSDYEIVAVSTTKMESAERARAKFGAKRAYDNYLHLIADPEVDLVVIAVKLPAHYDIVSAALDADKHIYCEWPLGVTTLQAEELTKRAQSLGAKTMIGLQARVSPTLAHLKKLIAEGYIGDLLSVSVLASGMGWGAAIEPANAYLFDKKCGATMLSVTGGHLIDALASVFGDIEELSAYLTTRRKKVAIIPPEELALFRAFKATVRIDETGNKLTAEPDVVTTRNYLTPTSPDQVLVQAVFESGVPLSVHIRGGQTRLSGLQIDVLGSEGELRISGAGGVIQMVNLTLEGARGTESKAEKIEIPETVESAVMAGLSSSAANVAGLYFRFARDLATNQQTVPDFALALRLHHLLDAIETSSRTGQRIRVAK